MITFEKYLKLNETYNFGGSVDDLVDNNKEILDFIEQHKKNLNWFMRISSRKNLKDDFKRNNVAKETQANKYYTTPCGCYAYPLCMFKKSKAIPFFDVVKNENNSKFLHFFEIDDSNIISIDSDAGMKISDLYDELEFNQHKKYEGINYNIIYDEFKKIIEKYSNYYSISALLSITSELAVFIDKQTNKSSNNITFPIHWEKILSKLCDIDGIVDYGKSIIHKNEPFQGVFFNWCVSDIKTFEI